MSRLLFCLIGLAIAVGFGINMIATGVTEPQAANPGGPEPAEREPEVTPIPVDAVPAPVSADVAAASKANGRFAVDLYRRLAEAQSGESIFLSPVSISFVLSMVAEGAVDQTLDQMLDVLHVPKEGEGAGLDQIHRGQRGLQNAIVPVVPPELTAKIKSLRAQLKETNDRTGAHKNARRFKEAYASAAAGQKLADEINALMKRISAYELTISNALWLEKSYPVDPNFLSVVQPNYGATLFPVDFRTQPEPARREINQWVAEQTNDRIRDLLSPGSITSQMSLLLTNTVYFRGDWAEPFEASQTNPKPFQQSPDRSIELPLMHQWNGKSASYAAFTGAGDLFPSPREIRVELKNDDPSLYPDARGHTMLSLDYQGGRIQMILLVPQSATGLSDLEKTLAYETLQRQIGQLERRIVELSIPKFKLESKYQLTSALQSLGMVRSFEIPKDNHEGAQFDKLCSSPRSEDRLYISDVVHQTYVDVNEVGTEAAAATALDVYGDGEFETPKTRPFIPVFKADKPFLFLIRDRQTASILFLGRYVGPKA